MALIDQQYLKTPFYGSRRMTAWLRNRTPGIRRLMQLIGLEAIYRRPNTSKPNPGHKVYPYLLRGLEINRVNQVGPPHHPPWLGVSSKVAIMDWHSRYVLAWRLSNTLEVDFCVEALEEALSKGRPQIFNTDGQPVHQRGLHQHAAAKACERTAGAGAWTTSSWNGCGAASSTRRCT